MFNIILSFLFSFFSLSPLSSVIEKNEIPKVEEVNEYELITMPSLEEGQIIDQAGGFTLIFQSKYMLKHVNGQIIELDHVTYPKLRIYQSDLYLFYIKDKALMLSKYNKFGIWLEDKVLFTSPVQLDYQIHHNEDYYFISTTVINYTDSTLLMIKEEKKLGERDVILLKYDKKFQLLGLQLFGGKLNDTVYALEVTEENIYMAIRRIGIGGGDFGHAGNYQEVVVICRVSENLVLENYIVLKDVSEIKTMKFMIDTLYLSFSEKLYKLTDKLEMISRFDYPSHGEFIKIGYKNTLLYIAYNQGILYDLHDMKIKYSFDFPIEEDAMLSVLEDKLYYYHPNKHFYFDMYQLEEFGFKSICYERGTDKIVSTTLFGNAKLEEVRCEQVFDQQIYGDYQFSFRFLSLGGIEYEIRRMRTVPFQVNVSEGQIYPVGYQLFFTGYADLNGETVLNNYAVMTPGIHQLRLKGINGQEKVIKFYTEREQIKFQESKYLEYDIIVSQNEYYTVTYQIPLIDEMQIVGLYVDGILITDLIMNEEKQWVTFRIKAPKNLGVSFHNIEKLVYVYQNEEQSLLIQEDYTVNVVGETPKILIDHAKEEKHLKVEVVDPDNTFRYFKVVIQNRIGEDVLLYSLSTTSLLLSNLKIGEMHKVIVTIGYDLGDKEFHEIILLTCDFEATANEINLGEILVIRRTEMLETFEIRLETKYPKHSHMKINIGDKEVFQKQEGIWNYYMLIVFVPISFLLAFFIRKKWIKR